MIFKQKQLYRVLIFILVSSFCFFSKTTTAFGARERQIIVFRPEVVDIQQDDVFSRLQIVSERRLRLINARTARLTEAQMVRLQQDPRVLRIDPDVEIFALPRQNLCDRYPWLPWCSQPTPTPTAEPTPIPTSTPTPTVTPTATPTPVSESQPIPWGVARINADDAWAVASGSAVKVAILDTGIDIGHPDLDDNLKGCLNFISWRSCGDDNGHGTHVAGIIAAEDNSFGVVGVAPRAWLYALKVLDKRGSGYLSDLIEALDWAVSQKMAVVNMSLGTSIDVTSFREAVARVSQAGIVQVAAAGNSGPTAGSVNYPAKYPEVIAVAAIDAADQVPSWSSRGTEVDLAAPGVAIYSTYLRGGYQTLSGTSMSAPHVTGVVALRLENHRDESPSQVKEILKNSVDLLPFDSTLVGAGLVNGYQAVVAH